MHSDDETKTVSKRKINTTTGIKLSDTFDEDEVTLIDDTNESKNKKTVTTPKPDDRPPPLQSSLSVVSARFNEIENAMGEPNEISSRKKVNPKILIVFFAALILLFFILLGIYTKLSE